MRARGCDEEGSRLPVRIDTTSNGEFLPVPLPPRLRRANARALDDATDHARRLGVSRRSFLLSAAGAATTLLAHGRIHAEAGRSGGRFELPEAAALEPALAATVLEGDEFVFDVQGHHVTPERPWRERSPFWRETIGSFPFADCGLPDRIACFSARQFVKEVFVDSDTDLAVLSFVPEPDPQAAPLRMEEAAATRELVAALDGSHRLLLHGPVHPGFPGELERMEELAERWGVVAWKTYTQYGPGGRGFWLDDEATGIPFLEQARALGVRIVCVHKGFPIPHMARGPDRCDDVGRVARLFPDVTFIVYHSGYETGTEERAYDPRARRGGIDSLVRTLRENGVAPGSNVYAELGSTWRFLLRDPEQAAHALGKLLLAVGEDNVLWGTDSIWYGSPQDQIQAFRAFQISERLREAHGYPELTPALRAKILGLNAARPYAIPTEWITKRSPRRLVPARERDPSFETHGPRTRREFIRLRALGGG